MIIITNHAIQRFQERVKNLPPEEVCAILSGRAFQAAAQIGATFVRLGTGHRVVIREGSIVTVLRPTWKHNPGSIEMERG